MPFYAEPVIRALNHQGKSRLTTILGVLSGAVGQGFDGDGTPPRRGQEGGHRRLWWFETPLAELPPGVMELPKAAYRAIEATRERTKPAPTQTVPPRIRIEGGLVRATYIEQIDSGTEGVLVPPNGAHIIPDQWGPGINAILSVDATGLTFEKPQGVGNETVTVTLDSAGNWSLSVRPTRYPINLIYFAETEIGNYIDESKLVPKTR